MGGKIVDYICVCFICNPYINKKIKIQLKNLEHVLLAGFTHMPAINLAKRLVKVLPKDLNKIFFSDNGIYTLSMADFTQMTKTSQLNEMMKNHCLLALF